MIVDVLLDHRWLSPLALCIVAVAALAAGRLLVPRPRLCCWLSGAASLPVVALTLLPDDRSFEARCTFQWALPTPDRVELFANVVLFVAPVLLAVLASRRPFRVFVVASTVSLLIEVAQALLSDLGRSCDTNDWSANTIGAVIGAALAWAALRVTPAHSHAPTSVSPTAAS